MKLIVGLGNPGTKYQNNRHNVGFMFVDFLLSELTGSRVYENSKNGNAQYAWVDLEKEKIEFYKPQTFMNESGNSVRYALKKHLELKLDNLIIVHDDLDIPLGKFKIQKASGPRLHNGIMSIEQALGTKDFWRVRIGVDNRKQENWVNGETYVLHDFTKDEKEILTQTFPKLLEQLKLHHANLLSNRRG